MAASANDSNTDTLRDEFRGINMLLMLVTAANNHGHSTLIPAGEYSLRRTLDVKEHSHMALILNSISALLVRNTEVVTVTSIASSSGQLDYLIMAQDDQRREPQSEKDGSTSGKSHWSKISSLNCKDILQLSLPQDDPLENHVATIGEFMNTYIRESDLNQRNILFLKISAYLSLVGWQKTYRRINNWTSKEIIYGVADLPFDVLKRAARFDASLTDSLSSNDGLYSMLSFLKEEEGGVERLMSALDRIHNPSLQREEKPSNLNKLLAALEIEKADNFKPKQSTYSEDTCVEFHCLFLGLLMAYGRALKRHSEAYNAQEKRQKEEMGVKAEAQHLNLVWLYGRCLWTVTTSRMFDDHLQVLAKTGFGWRKVTKLNLDRVLFGDLAPGGGTTQELEGMMPGVQSGMFAGPDGGSNGDRDEGGREGDGESGTRARDLDAEMLMGLEEEDVEEAQRMMDSLYHLPANYPSLSFRNWTSSITSHLTALHLLTRKVGRSSPQTVGAKLIIAKHCGSRDSFPGLSWHDIIRGVCDNPSAQFPFLKGQSENAMSLLQEFIDTDHYNLPIISAFGKNKKSKGSSTEAHDETRLEGQADNKIAVGSVLWKGRPHCEAMTVALFKCIDEVIGEGQSELRYLILSSYLQELSVSRLCCPVCWELLQILRRWTAEYQVRGYHVSLYPVELPPWLPKHVMEEMVTLFRNHLCRELVTFLRNN